MSSLDLSKQRWMVPGMITIASMSFALSSDGATNTGQSLEATHSIIVKALENNLEMKLAETKVRRAEVELEQVRMKVIEEVTQLLAALRDGEMVIEQARSSRDQSLKLAANQMISTSEMREDEAALIRAEAEYQRIKMRLEFSQGGTPFLGKQEQKNTVLYTSHGSHPVIEQLKSSKVSLSFEKTPVIEAIEEILTGTQVKLMYASGTKDYIEEFLEAVTFEFSGTSHGALTAIADHFDGVALVFVARDYGLLVTSRDAAMRYDAITIPGDLSR